MTWRLIEADCIEAMQQMEDFSVDAIVTDPPYNLNFMGRSWDKNLNHGLWATEALRVLKPGGHLLAFGGTRTYHRLACAIEDAGFEIRDCLAWMYGSGFPKSLDVSKAIDKQRDDRSDVLLVTAEIARRRDAANLTNGHLDAMFGFSGMGGHWTTQAAQAAVPTVEQWKELRDVLGTSGELDAEVWRLNGRKGTPGEAWSQREVIGEKDSGLDKGSGVSVDFSGSTGRNERGKIPVTAPALDDAEQWQGWGTALKPSWESVVWATKPQVTSDLAARIGSCLSELSAKVVAEPSTSSPSASVEASGSAPSSAGSASSTSGASSDPTGTSRSRSTAPTPSSIVSSWSANWADLCELTSMFTTGTTSNTTTALTTLLSCLSQITPASIILDPSGEWSSRVRTADALLAALRASSIDTLELSAIVAATASGQTSRLDAAELEPAFEPIVLARKPLVGTVAASVLEHGTGALNIDGTRIGTDDDLNGGAYAENGNRAVSGSLSPTGMNVPGKTTGKEFDQPSGRWPANVLLDEAAAALLDEQTGDVGGHGGGTSGVSTGYHGDLPPGLAAARTDAFGGASRFFKVVAVENDEPCRIHGIRRCTICWPLRFMYVAKSASAERNRGLEHREPGPTYMVENGSKTAGSANGVRYERHSVTRNSHPTVKPVELMQWLCRLITPPNGVVLDPFTGSGSTGIAALREGFSFIGIEREHEYVEIARDRIIGDAPLFNVATEANGE